MVTEPNSGVRTDEVLRSPGLVGSGTTAKGAATERRDEEADYHSKVAGRSLRSVAVL